MECVSCGRANRPAARFCGGCGRPLAARCPACGAEAEAGAQFCDACGASLAARSAPTSADGAGARKVVTIVFADLIGSTALHERLDAESARRLMDRYHRSMSDAVEAHGGTVVQLLGDGVLAAFGVPRVAEDDAIRAVRAAVAMQRAFRELASEQAGVVGNAGLRVAVNTGEVVVPGDHTAVIGDPVNVAARLQQEARDGDVLIGESTRRLVGDRLTLAPAGSFALKGRSEAVAAYRVVSLERPAGAPAIAFVGREEELRRIAAVYEHAVRAAPGARLVVILGSPGLGKSRLIGEFARRVGTEATLLTAQCDAAGGATFAPLARALRALLGVDEATGADTLHEAIESALPGDDSERARIAAGIGALLAGTPASPEETFFVVRRLLAALAARRPVVLAIDDLQWAEPLLLDLVEHLVQWGTGVPLLVLAAARPELRDGRSSLASAGGLVADVVTLAGLDAAAATRLAASVIGADALPAAVAGRVLATSEGNPLFLGELVRMLVEDGALRREGDRWTAGAAVADLEMPPTIHALLAARIERLRPEERAVLERAAVAGRQFSRSAVAQLLPRDAHADLDARLEALRRSELIEPDTAWFLGEPALRFHHALIRDAAYRRLLKGTRAELHGRFADWVESRAGEAALHDETIGWHLEQAHQHLRELGPLDERGRALGERAARYLAAAGRRALARDDVAVAASLLGRAFDRLDAADPARADLALDWCEALLAAGEVPGAARAIAELERFAGDSTRLRAWHTCFAAQLAVLTDPKSLRATAEAVAAAAGDLASAGDVPGEAKAHSVHALALARLGKVGDCEAGLDRALAAARRARDRRRANAVLAGAPVAALWGPSPVTRASGRCLDVVRVLRITQGAPAVEAVALRCQAVLEALRGRAEAARRMIASSRRMVEELGITQQLLESDVFAGHIELLEGDAAAAERHLRSAYDGLRERGLGIDAARAAALLGRALLAQDRAAEAEALSHESEALAGDDLKAAIAWRGGRAEALAKRGEHAAAVELARAAVQIAATTDALLDHADARLAFAAALRAAGRVGEADAEERRAIELWEAKGATLLAERARRDADRIGSTERVPAEPVTARPGRRRIRRNAATANAARLEAAVRARDAEAIPPLYADEMEGVHHPTGVSYDRQGSIATFRSVLRAAEMRFAHEPLATLGDSLALARLSVSAGGFSGGRFDVGAYQVDEVVLIEVDAEGRRRRAEFFARDRLGDAIARLYQRHSELLAEGPARERAAATARSVAAVLGPYDVDRYATAIAPSVEYANHRSLERRSGSGAEAMLRSFRAMSELASELRTRVDDVLGLHPDALLVRWTSFGTERTGGGAFERPMLLLWAFGDDGLVGCNELFDVDGDAQALARFDAVAADAPHPAARSIERRVRPNSATANAARMDAAVAARDLDAFLAVIADEAKGVHHPTGSEYEESAALEQYRALCSAENVTFEHEPLVSLGDALALCRGSISTVNFTGALKIPGPVGAVEFEYIVLVDVDARGQRRRTEFFAPDHLGDAVVRLYDRYAETLPDGPARARAAMTARAVAAIVPTDIDAIAGVLAPDVAFADRRALGLGAARGAERYLQGLRSLVEVTSERLANTDDVVAASADALLLRRTTSGIDRSSGGPFELELLLLWVFGSDGRIAHVELFDVDRTADALARLDELTAAAPRRVARRVRPNAATAGAARLEAAVAARDADALAPLFAEVAEFVEHATGAVYDGSALLATWRVLLRAEEPTARMEWLASLGDSLALGRGSMSFRALADEDVSAPFGAVEREELVLIETGSSGTQRRVETFAPDHLGDAVVRLYERSAELLPDGPERTRAAQTASSIARMLARPDLERWANALAPDLEVVDHRTLGTWSGRGLEGFLASFRSLMEVSADIAIRIDDVLGLGTEALLVRWTTFGTDRTSGGAYERPFVMLFGFGRDGLIARQELFDAGRDAEALARFGELVAERTAIAPRPPRRRVRPNAATGNAARMDAAAAARDSDAFLATLAEDAQNIHYATGAVYAERDSARAYQRLLEAESLRFAHEPLATLGDRLAVCRGHVSFANVRDDDSPLADWGPTDWSPIALLEVDARGLRARTEFFEHLGDAIARLYERYAELLPDGPGRERAAATARSAATILARPDVERLANALAPDLEVVDRRTLGTWSGRGAEGFLESFRALTALSDGVAIRVEDVLGLGPDALLLRWATLGTIGAGGGPYERPFLVLFAFGPHGRVERQEFFDPGRDAAALARFDAIVGAAGEEARQGDARARTRLPRVRSNAAVAEVARLDAAVAAHDTAAIVGLLGNLIETVYHPTGVIYDSDGAIASFRMLLRYQDLVFRHEPLATLGDSLALCHQRMTASGVAAGKIDVGALERENLWVSEVDSQGRRRRSEAFDVDRLADAVGRLYERYAELLPDGPERIRAAATAHSVAIFLWDGSIDVDRAAGVIAPDLEFADHRSVSLFGSARGAGAFLRGLGSRVEGAADVTSRLDDVLDLRPGALLASWRESGTDRSSGGPFERRWLNLLVFGADGRLIRNEMFDVDRTGEALARFDELAGQRLHAMEVFDADRLDAALARHEDLSREPVSTRIENAATRSEDAICGAWEARDGQAMAALFAAHFRSIDRRSLMQLEVGRDEMLASVRPFVEKGFTRSSDLLATRGDRLALYRSRVRGSDGLTGPSEIEILQVVEASDERTRVAAVAFDPDDLDAAYAELDARYAAGEAAPYHQEWETLRRSERALAQRDWEDFAGVFTPDLVHRDHRKLGAGALSRDEFVERQRALVELAPDATLRRDHILALGHRAALVVATWKGTREGGPFEFGAVNVMGFAPDARIRSSDFYDLDQLDAARARCEDLSHEATTPARFQNLATRSFERFLPLWVLRDWQAIDALFAPAFRIRDDRRLMRFEMSREQFLETLRFVASNATTVRFLVEPIATRAEKLALARMRIEGSHEDQGPTEGEWLAALEVDDRGIRVAERMLDPDDLDAAYAELDARYHAGEAAPHAAVARSMRAFHGAFVRRDWDALAALCAPDLIVNDHRRLGWEALHGPAAYVEALRTIVDLASDTKLRLDHVTMCERGYLVLTVWEGTRDGGAYEAPSLMVAELDEQVRIRRFDQYDLDRLDAARARYAEVVDAAAPRTPRIETAATRSLQRFEQAWRARDWEGAAAVLAPGFRQLDRRSMMHLELDRERHLEWMRVIFELRSRLQSEVLATRGDRLVLARLRFEGAGGSLGPSEIESLAAIEVDERGDRIAMVRFDPDDLDAAWSELDDRYAAGEAAAHSREHAGMRGFVRAIAARDWDSMSALLSPDLLVTDYRPLGWETLRGRAVYVETLKSLVDLAPDVRLRTDHLRLSDGVGLLVNVWVGTREGGAFEAPRAVVFGLDADGRIRSMDFYNVEQLDAALARFDALGPDPLRIPPNAATRAGERLQQAFESSDWDALAGACAPAMVFEDRRRGALLTGDRDMFIAGNRVIASNGGLPSRALLATVGDRLALQHLRWTGSNPDVGAFEAENLSLLEVDAAGRLVALVVFDSDDRRAAFRELRTRAIASGEAGASRPALQLIDAWNDRDRTRIRSLIADHCVVDDYRRVGMGRLDGANAYLASLEALWDLAPDSHKDALFILTRGDHGWVTADLGAGTLRDGGRYENLMVTVAIVAGDRVTRLEFFEPDDAGAALARFAELRPDALRIPPNAAARARDRFAAAVAASDWDALASLLAPHFAFDDRRELFRDSGDREKMLASVRLAAAAGTRASSETLATAGDRLLLERVLFRTGDRDAPSEIELLQLVEVEPEGQFVATVTFDPDDRRAAAREMFERYFRGEGALSTPASVVELVRAMNDHDLERMRAALPDDFVFDDRRRTGVGRIEGADAYVASVAALYEQSPDLTTDVLYHVAAAEHGSLSVGRMFGTLAGGGAFESVFVRLNAYRDGRWAGSTELFELEDLDRARARFEELRNDEG